MRLVRSWPADVPAGHARVEDQVERVVCPGFDYSPLAGLGDDLLHLDWDMAVGPEDLKVFADVARLDPERVLVGPYRSYDGSLFGADPVPRDIPEGSIWTAKVYSNPAETAMRNVVEADGFAHLWGFGMVYLPAYWLRRFVETFPGEKMGDGQFSGWYYREAGPARLYWGVRPVHLNFPPPKVL